MTTPGPEATYSPVPMTGPPPGPPITPWVSPAGRPPPTIAPAYPWPPAGGTQPPLVQPAPRPHQPLVAQPPKKASHRRWILLTAAVLVVVLGGAAALGLGVSRSTKVITDSQGRVSVRVPRTWSDDTDPDPAPDPVTAPDEESSHDRIPQLETASLFAAQYLQIFLDEPSSDGLLAAHQLNVQDTCDQWDCRTRGNPTPVIIDGQRGLEQVLTHESFGDGGAISVVVTVQSADLMVSAVGERDSFTDEPPSPDQLLRILHTMSFRH